MPHAFLKYTLLTLLFILSGCSAKEVDNIKAVLDPPEYEVSNTSNYAEGITHCKAVFDKKLKTTGSASSTADCLIGYQLPEFSATTLAGNTITNESLKGKLTLINFWFAACRPCVAEIPGFNQIIDKYGTEKINYISIGRDDKSKVQEFLMKHPWKFDHIADGESLIKTEFMFMWGFPTTFLVDENGTIIHAINRGKSGPGAIQYLKRRIEPNIDRALKPNKQY